MTILVDQPSRANFLDLVLVLVGSNLGCSSYLIKFIPALDASRFSLRTNFIAWLVTFAIARDDKLSSDLYPLFYKRRAPRHHDELSHESPVTSRSGSPDGA